MIAASRAAAGASVRPPSCRQSRRVASGNIGRPDSGPSACTPGGKPADVRRVTPRPASTAAHRPCKLGEVKATRQGMPARSSAAFALRRNMQGASSTARGTGSPLAQAGPPSRAPIQMSWRAASGRASGRFSAQSASTRSKASSSSRSSRRPLRSTAASMRTSGWARLNRRCRRGRARTAIKRERTSAESGSDRLNRWPRGGAEAAAQRRRACHHQARRGVGRAGTRR